MVCRHTYEVSIAALLPCMWHACCVRRTARRCMQHPRPLCRAACVCPACSAAPPAPLRKTGAACEPSVCAWQMFPCAQPTPPPACLLMLPAAQSALQARLHADRLSHWVMLWGVTGADSLTLMLLRFRVSRWRCRGAPTAAAAAAGRSTQPRALRLRCAAVALPGAQALLQHELPEQSLPRCLGLGRQAAACGGDSTSVGTPLRATALHCFCRQP